MIVKFTESPAAMETGGVTPPIEKNEAWVPVIFIDVILRLWLPAFSIE